MKYVVAFGAPFTAALAGFVSTGDKPTDWLIAVIVATAAGFGGLAGIVGNDTMKK